MRNRRALSADNFPDAIKAASFRSSGKTVPLSRNSEYRPMSKRCAWFSIAPLSCLLIKEKSNTFLGCWIVNNYETDMTPSRSTPNSSSYAVLRMIWLHLYNLTNQLNYDICLQRRWNYYFLYKQNGTMITKYANNVEL